MSGSTVGRCINPSYNSQATRACNSGTPMPTGCICAKESSRNGSQVRYEPMLQLQNLFMDGSSSSFSVSNPSTTYSPTVIGGDLTNTGNIGNGDITMGSTNSAKGGDLSLDIPSEAFGIPSIPDFINLDARRKNKKLAVLLI